MHALEHAAAAGTCILADSVTVVACNAQVQQLPSACASPHKDLWLSLRSTGAQCAGGYGDRGGGGGRGGGALAHA